MNTKPIEDGRATNARKLFTKHGRAHKHPIYEVWAGMRDRCNNPRNSAFHRYGGRGIKVCPRWDDYACFERDMLDTWKPGLTLDRKNNDKGYSKANCRWATMTEQGRNKSNTAFMNTPKGQMRIKDAAIEFNLDYSTLIKRVRNGDPYPLRPTVKVHDTQFGYMTLKEASERSGISYLTLRSRIGRGWGIDKALATPAVRSSF